MIKSNIKQGSHHIYHISFCLCLSQMKNNKTTPFYFDNTEAWGTDSFYLLGILGLFLYVLLGLTSLPSVGGTLSWREFSFIQVRAQLEMHVSVLVCVLGFTLKATEVISHMLTISRKVF